MKTLTKEKKFKFVKINRKDMEAEPCWMLMIDTDSRMHSFLNKYGKHIVSEYLSLKKNREIANKKGYDGHFLSGEHLLMHHTVVNEREKMINGEREPLSDELMKTCAGDLVLIEEKMVDPKVRCFLETGSIMINVNNGWHSGKNHSKNRFYDGPMYEIVDIIEKDQYVFPDEKVQNIKISQWVEGKHWYAQVYGCTVEVDGRTKWDTKAEAMEAVQKYMKENSK